MSKRKQPQSPGDIPQKNLRIDTSDEDMVTSSDESLCPRESSEDVTRSGEDSSSECEVGREEERNSPQPDADISSPSLCPRESSEDVTRSGEDSSSECEVAREEHSSSRRDTDICGPVRFWAFQPPVPRTPLDRLVIPEARPGVAPESRDAAFEALLEGRGSARVRGFDPINRRNRDQSTSFRRYEDFSADSCDQEVARISEAGARRAERSYSTQLEELNMSSTENSEDQQVPRPAIGINNILEQDLYMSTTDDGIEQQDGSSREFMRSDAGLLARENLRRALMATPWRGYEKPNHPSIPEEYVPAREDIERVRRCLFPRSDEEIEERKSPYSRYSGDVSDPSNSSHPSDAEESTSESILRGANISSESEDENGETQEDREVRELVAMSSKENKGIDAMPLASLKLDESESESEDD